MNEVVTYLKEQHAKIELFEEMSKNQITKVYYLTIRCYLEQEIKEQMAKLGKELDKMSKEKKK